tara:strand:+ start:410 stop:847 length:438 start_codon:yes stop_codon:yes gene_type:complete
MAIEIKRPALDFEPNVAIGIDLPMGSFVGSQFTLNYLSIDQALANAKNLLLTNHGERPMRPLWGCNLRNSLFQNIDSEGEYFDTIKETIRTNFTNQLPYINIAELLVEQSDINPNRTNIKFSINLKGNEFDTRQIDVSIDTQQAQ